MSKTYLHRGDNLNLIAPSGGVVSGTGYIHGAIFAIATVSAAQGEVYAGCEVGVHELKAEAHATDQAIAEGGPVYWDDTGKQCTKTAVGNRLIGVAETAKVSTDTTVIVKLRDRRAAPSAAIVPPAATAPTNSTPYGFAQAQAAALLAAVIAIIAALEKAGITLED